MKQIDKVKLVKEYLQKNNLNSIIIPSNDPHFGEYIPDYYKTREWVSGFTGSAGTLVITLDGAALWTDSRYFVQAAEQLKDSGIELMKIKVEGTPSIVNWLKGRLSAGMAVGLDEDLFSFEEYESYKEALSPISVRLIEDPFDEIWEERPPLIFNPVILKKETLSGESSHSKIKRLRDYLSDYKKYHYIITTCDDIAWLTNLRGNDIDFNPLFMSYCVISNNSADLFLRKEMLTKDAKEYLDQQGIKTHSYEEFESYIDNIEENSEVFFSAGKITSKYHIKLIRKEVSRIADPMTGGLVQNMKAVKNGVELAGFRRAYLRDGVAWCRLLRFLDETKDKRSLNEYQIVEKLISFRSMCDDYDGESFGPIVAYGPNAALPHYNASQDKALQLDNRGFLLIDTGAQYPYGTTDTTRTIPMGEVTSEERDDYTRVLKGMIALSVAKFPKGSRGSLLDFLARGPVMIGGKIYLHGTGHGIGHNLCVHEGPQSIRMEENPVPLAEGMVMSNEPAVYVEGSYGIRIENTIIVEQWRSFGATDLLGFETITLVPIETTCINKGFLSKEEIEWVNNYNETVMDALSEHLAPDEANWMRHHYLPL